jgi:hypothetical protein
MTKLNGNAPITLAVLIAPKPPAIINIRQPCNASAYAKKWRYSGPTHNNNERDDKSEMLVLEQQWNKYTHN